MTVHDSGPEAPKGFSLIRLFASHKTAANLLMLVMIVCGLYSLRQLNVQFFPTFGLDFVNISVEWRGHRVRGTFP